MRAPSLVLHVQHVQLALPGPSLALPPPLSRECRTMVDVCVIDACDAEAPDWHPRLIASCNASTEAYASLLEAIRRDGLCQCGPVVVDGVLWHVETRAAPSPDKVVLRVAILLTRTPVAERAEAEGVKRATLAFGGLAFALLLLLVIGTIVCEAGRAAAETPLETAH
jgi:hypothetical protein